LPLKAAEQKLKKILGPRRARCGSDKGGAYNRAA